MMNTKTTLIAAAALMAAACSQIEAPVQEGTPVVLRYTTVDATDTRAAQNLNEGTFASGESIKVRISNTGENSWTDYDFTTGSEGAMSPAGTVPYYPAGTQTIDIVAFYPATAGTSFSVQADQREDAAYKASDLMFASVTDQAKQAGAVNLAFSHKLVKINVNITPGTGVSSITGVSVLNVKPTVSFDPAEGTVGAAGGDAVSIAMSNNGAAVIPAQTIDGGLLSIETDKGTATYTVASKQFEAGKQYTLNITVNLRNIGTANAITGWTSEGTVTVFAEKPNIAGHEYVEMGDGLKWATCNVGASDPWESGDYFQWGATVPYYLAGYSQENPCSHWIAGKTGYDWANYPFNNGANHNSVNNYSKYNNTDNMASFAAGEYADDAARQRWGATWRTPTYDELRNLLNYDTQWTTQSGVQGLLITCDEGPCKGNSIFLPAAGSRMDGNLYSAGSSGYYWSSSLMNFDYSQAMYLYFSESGNRYMQNLYRIMGYSIRAVSE